jgi:alpha-glucosidase (family GH31 glycosyl hydrolase)
MRYRLLPHLYGAARRNFETGEPLLARLDLSHPGEPQAARNDEYLRS